LKRVDTIARVRRAFHVQGWSVKRIVRELHVSRNTVRKILRSDETDFSYEHELAERSGCSIHAPDVRTVISFGSATDRGGQVHRNADWHRATEDGTRFHTAF
jgi:orotate phosphoribosyltransferase-like protein